MSSYFDERAATWDEPAQVDQARAAARAVAAAVDLHPTMRVLEYGSGTGLVAQNLADRVGPLTLADPSVGMRDAARAKVDTGELPAGTRIWDLDLGRGEVPDERFDLVVTVMALHHVPHLAPVLHGFARLLAEGGQLCIVDLEAEDGSFHDSAEFHAHHGFDPEELTEQVEEAGFTDAQVERADEIPRNGRNYPRFLLRCMLATE